MKEISTIDESSLQLVIKSETIGSLTTNAEQIRDLVKSRIGDYTSENYSLANIDKAKADKALLNKAKKALNDKRIELEKKWMQPFMGFKDVMNETVKLIDSAVKDIDSVVKEADEKAKNEKKEQIEKLAESLGVEAAHVKLEKIWNPKWLNKSTSMKAVQKDIETSLANIKRDLETLKTFKEDYDALVVRYMENLDINETISYANSLKAQRELAKAEEQKNDNSPSAEPQTERPAQNETKEAETSSHHDDYDSAFDAFADALDQGADAPTPAKEDKTFVITGTEDDIAKVVDFLEENGITFSIK